MRKLLNLCLLVLLIENYIKSLFSTNVVLFVGYSLGDTYSGNVSYGTRIDQSIKKFIGPSIEIMPVIKATGLIQKSDAFEFDACASSFVCVYFIMKLK